jgi:hypothetical protein
MGEDSKGELRDGFASEPFEFWRGVEDLVGVMVRSVMLLVDPGRE